MLHARGLGGWPANSFVRPRIFLLCGIALLSGACASVPAWERGRLASRVMRAPFGDPRTEADYRDKVVQSRAAGMLPPGTPGGGCGCTQ